MKRRKLAMARAAFRTSWRPRYPGDDDWFGDLCDLMLWSQRWLKRMGGVSMNKISNSPNRSDYLAEIAGMSDAQLQAQQFVQQGAVHAVNFLISHGCTERAAIQMLESLRDNGSIIKAECQKRGIAYISEASQ